MDGTGKNRGKSTRFCGACDYDVLMPFSVLHLQFFCLQYLVFIHMAAGQEQDQAETGLTLSAECPASFSSGYGSQILSCTERNIISMLIYRLHVIYFRYYIDSAILLDPFHFLTSVS